MQENHIYEATAYLDGNWWTFEIPELTSAASAGSASTVAMGQARSRSDLNQAVREVVALWLNTDEASVAVNVTVMETDGEV